jgi:hypothetical protein
VLDPSGIARFAMIGKDATDNTGQTVQSVIDSAWPLNMITDADAGALQGIAITAANKSLGNWQFSIDGAPWSDVGDVSENQALLLRTQDRLRFVPDGVNADTATATFRAWDQTGTTAGQQGTKVAVGTPDGTSPFSAATETASITVASPYPVYIPKDIIGAPGSVVTVPLRIAEANGLRSADITIHYDTNVLDATNASVKVVKSTANPDLVWPASTIFAPNVNDATGTIIVSISNFPALGAGGGSLMTIDFTIKEDAPDGAQAKINLQGASPLQGVSLNEDHIRYEPTPQDGDDPTDGEITVNAVNDPPQVTVPGPQSADEDTDKVISGILVQDVDAGAEPIRMTLSVLHGKLTVKDSVSGGVPPGGFVGNGTQQVVLTGSVAQINATLADAQGLTYRGDQDYSGSDTLTVLADDQGHTGTGGAKTDTKTVAITVNAVNDAPQVTVPGAQSVDEDTDLAVPGVSVQDVDAGAESIQMTFSVLHGKLTVKDSVAGGVPASGIVGNGTQQVVLTGSVAQINATLADSQGLTYRAGQDYNGPDTLTVLADDQGHTGSGGPKTDTKTVAITVNAVNDGPQVTVPGAQSVDEDTDKVVSGISVQDVDAGSESIRMTLSVLHGKLTVKDSVVGGVPASGIASNGTQQVALTGSVAQINATLADAQGLAYRGNQDFNGSDNLTVLADDQGHTGSGGAKTDTKTVALTVNAVNDAPQIAVPGTQSVASNTDKVISGISVQDVDAGAESIQMTFSVLHGKLTVKDSVLGGVPASGIVVNPNGKQVVLTASVAQINATLADAQGLTYRGDQDYIGPDTLTVLADDQGHTGNGGTKTDTKTVAIAVGQTAGIGGYAYADTNKNNGPDNDIGEHQWEGVPGVLITLTDQAGKSWTAWTDDAGWYYFDNLPAGTDQSPVHYQLTERQPAALVEGGANAIADVPLKGGQDITDQCFRELSLKPRYVGNRLLATSSLPAGSAQWKQVIRQIIVQAEKDAGVTPLPPSVGTSQANVSQQTTSAGNALIAVPSPAAPQAHLAVQVPSSAAVSPPAVVLSPLVGIAEANSNAVAAVNPALTPRASASATRAVNLATQPRAVATASAGTATSARASKANLNPSTASQPAAPLTANELKPIVNEAIADWAKAGLPAASLDTLRTVEVSVADLSDAKLGWTENNQVLIDGGAAGYGWFVDPTPRQDEEFQPTQTSGQLQAVDPRALARMDLLTVVEHELGHVIGLPDDIGSSFYDLMSGNLSTGVRRKVSVADIDAVLATYGSSNWA